MSLKEYILKSFVCVACAFAGYAILYVITTPDLLLSVLAWTLTEIFVISLIALVMFVFAWIARTR